MFLDLFAALDLIVTVSVVSYSLDVSCKIHKHLCVYKQKIRVTSVHILMLLYEWIHLYDFWPILQRETTLFHRMTKPFKMESTCKRKNLD